MSLQDIKEAFEEIMDMANIDHDDVILSYGYLGDLLPETYFHKAYDFEEESNNIKDDIIAEWSLDMLKIKMFSTPSDYLIETYGSKHIVHLSVFMRSYKDEDPILYALHDESQGRIFVINDTFKILRCITFEKYIKSANVIKRAWINYQARKKKACIIIQRAYIRHLYNPRNPYVQKLHKHFRSLI